jgi:hypothetical protein
MYAIVCVDKPEGRAQQISWPVFLSDVKRELSVGTKSRPSENVWFFSLPATTAALVNVVQAARSCGLGHRVMYFDKPPQEFEEQVLAL